MAQMILAENIYKVIKSTIIWQNISRSLYVYFIREFILMCKKTCSCFVTSERKTNFQVHFVGGMKKGSARNGLQLLSIRVEFSSPSSVLVYFLLIMREGGHRF